MRVIKHPGHTYGGFGSVLLEPGYDTVSHLENLKFKENLKSFINRKLNQMSCCIHATMHLFMY
jgi:hypothetical protein